MSKSLIVIGGGAAGFFCAVNAARLNSRLRVTILEKTGKLLGKVKVSGGGRCNLTHEGHTIQEMSRHYPRGTHFVRKMFHQFFVPDTIAWFTERKVPLLAESDGRMFPVSNSSQTIIDCLLQEAQKYKVEILRHQEVLDLEKAADGWSVHVSGCPVRKSDFICVASGGLSKTSMFNWLLKTSHSFETPLPSLFTFNLPGHPINRLMGISVPNVTVKITGTKWVESGPVLITHWGLSGPAVLRLSAWCARELADRNYEFRITINWLPAFREDSLREQFISFRMDAASQKIFQKNPFGLPQRLWEFFLMQAGISGEMRWADLPNSLQNQLLKHLHADEFIVQGKTTFKEEFVTAGGIRLSEVDVNTMQSKLAGGLYFAGEILDVDGVTGGYNFQHAWSSGYVAAKSIASLAGRSRYIPRAGIPG